MKRQKSSSTSILKFLKSTKKLQTGKEAAKPSPLPKVPNAAGRENSEKEAANPSNILQNSTLTSSGLLALSAGKEINSSVLESRKRKATEEDDGIPQLINTQPIINKTVPAFRKYAPLLKQTALKSGLPLPTKFNKLLTLFTSLETVVNYMKSRDTIPILHKIIKSVEHQASTRFEVRHFQMILSVYPEAYIVSSVSAILGEDRIPSVAIELPQDPISESFLATLTPTKNTDSTPSNISAVQKFISQIPVRRQEFQKRLEKLVMDQHLVRLIV
jgi:DNA replication factor CDT1 like